MRSTCSLPTRGPTPRPPPRCRNMASQSIVSEAVEPPAPAELERVASNAARAAAEVVTAAYGEPRQVGRKSSPTDVVTQTDLRAEERARQVLLAATPSAGILGEEGGTTAPGVSLQWVIDPLDGTINFLYGVPLFAVSVAAAVDGEVVAGAVIDVLRKELFSAHAGGGARQNGASIVASGCASLPEALIGTGFSYIAERRSSQGEVAARLLVRARDLRYFGSAALELCWVACGRLDGYYQRDTEVWDRAAGALIASEAGARVELPCPQNDDPVIAPTGGGFDALWYAAQPAAVGRGAGASACANRRQTRSRAARGTPAAPRGPASMACQRSSSQSSIASVVLAIVRYASVSVPSARRSEPGRWGGVTPLSPSIVTRVRATSATGSPFDASNQSTMTGPCPLRMTLLGWRSPWQRRGGPGEVGISSRTRRREGSTVAAVVRILLTMRSRWRGSVTGGVSSNRARCTSASS